MAREQLPWQWSVLQAVLSRVPLSLQIFRVHVLLFARMIAIGDSRNPVLSRSHQLALVVLELPVSLIPGLRELLFATVSREAYLAVLFGLNALCWGLVLKPLASRPFARAVILADFLAEILWPGSGLLGAFGL
jgi:hypothetical protein